MRAPPPQLLAASGPRPFLTPCSASQYHHSSIRATQETRSCAPSTSPRTQRRPDFADDYPAPQIRPPQPLGEHPGAPCFLFRQEIWAVGHSVGRTLPPVFPRRRAMAEPPLCCAAARARPQCSLAEPSRCSQCRKPEPNGARTALTRYAGEPKPPVTAGHPLRPMQPFPEPTSGLRVSPRGF